MGLERRKQQIIKDRNAINDLKKSHFRDKLEKNTVRLLEYSLQARMTRHATANKTTMQMYCTESGIMKIQL